VADKNLPLRMQARQAARRKLVRRAEGFACYWEPGKGEDIFLFNDTFIIRHILKRPGGDNCFRKGRSARMETDCRRGLRREVQEMEFA
jgi:hypothetical protein